jgi:putative mRNA 3-end processing factor
MGDVLIETQRGLYCPLGDFHVDPWGKCARAIVTHAHTDHARWGMEEYLCTPKTGQLLLARYGEQMRGKISTLEFGERRRIGDVVVSLHPAGHVLGSAQVRIERAGGERVGETWVVSGDYKTEDDGISGGFEAVGCDVFITESTFGLPIYRWAKGEQLFGGLNSWWRRNAEEGRLCVVGCYALGKAQRLLAGLDETVGPIALHGALDGCTQVYRDCGVRLPQAESATQEWVKKSGGKGIVLAPPSSVRSAWAFKLTSLLPPENRELVTAMASGWMLIRGGRRRGNFDTGFAISDHADWPGLLGAIEATKAKRIGVTHGSVGVMVRYLSEVGYDAFGIKTQFWAEGEDDGGGGEQAGGTAGSGA